LKKSKKGIQIAEFHADFRNVKKFVKKMYSKKAINKNVTEIFHFFTFTENPKTLFAYNF